MIQNHSFNLHRERELLRDQGDANRHVSNGGCSIIDTLHRVSWQRKDAVEVSWVFAVTLLTRYGRIFGIWIRELMTLLFIQEMSSTTKKKGKITGMLLEFATRHEA
ncbi:uncharacterized protein LOC9656367 [Selaginella moellendorffii]|uniref:uncharacterized protein LOC9656367 n=1 Tax=Selaginella moellendorffii TaxID=88036 RepID=UPI000D1C3553|nr:uncharacterized protein LOC9656367 [Selaginella moellendorffii]|eukprot:XP_024534457.1 uncharacterized protein LOC9656367 [Selaginella moellendorffii]